MKSSDAVKHLTHTMALGSLSVTVTENGAVESSNNKEIKCLVQGGSTVLWVIETGTLVKSGDAKNLEISVVNSVYYAICLST